MTSLATELEQIARRKRAVKRVKDALVDLSADLQRQVFLELLAELDADQPEEVVDGDPPVRIEGKEHGEDVALGGNETLAAVRLSSDAQQGKNGERSSTLKSTKRKIVIKRRRPKTPASGSKASELLAYIRRYAGKSTTDLVQAMSDGTRESKNRVRARLAYLEKQGAVHQTVLGEWEVTA